MTTGKTIALTRQTFVGKVISLLFNMQSRFVIAFLPGSKHLLISWLQSLSAVILEPPKIKSDTVSTVSPIVPFIFVYFVIFLEVWLPCNVMLVPTVQQGESAIYIPSLLDFLLIYNSPF